MISIQKTYTLFLIFCLAFKVGNAQELFAKVEVNTDNVRQTNRAIFENLSTAIEGFLNNTKWTEKQIATRQKIKCDFFIYITSFDDENFQATLQVQSSRLIFNTNYESPILNFNDAFFDFNYKAYEPLYFDSEFFTSNLVSVLSFYAYVIIGLDCDTYKLNSGNPYFKKAKRIVDLAQGNGFSGWEQTTTGFQRWNLIYDLTSNIYYNYRIAMFVYHLRGLDAMLKDKTVAKNAIKTCIRQLNILFSVRPNASLIKLFFDAKSSEIEKIFTNGKKTDVKDIIPILNTISPQNSKLWSQMAGYN